MYFALSVITAYLIGSISFSFLLGKWIKGIDIRQHGSGNAGATNTMRVLGTGWGVTVLVLDGLKGVAVVLLSQLIVPDSSLVHVISGVAAIVGHNWPIYFGFRGGKGVATTIGVMASLAFFPSLIAGIAAIITIALTRFVSLGSLVFAVILPILVFAFQYAIAIGIAAIVLGVFVFVRHRANITRLIQGTESKIGATKGG